MLKKLRKWLGMAPLTVRVSLSFWLLLYLGFIIWKHRQCCLTILEMSRFLKYFKNFNNVNKLSEWKRHLTFELGIGIIQALLFAPSLSPFSKAEGFVGIGFSHAGSFLRFFDSFPKTSLWCVCGLEELRCWSSSVSASDLAWFCHRCSIIQHEKKNLTYFLL